MAPAPSMPVPPADATFTISTVKLAKLQQEWIKRCSEATSDSLDELALSLAGSVLKRPPPATALEAAETFGAPNNLQLQLGSVRRLTNISRLRFDPAEDTKIQRALRVSPQKTLEQILKGASQWKYHSLRAHHGPFLGGFL
ncbi:hypothetical protein TNCT_242341 [Trichonephila clavata]|uniref:Uncharacterized protein n=1 Tax=Trichonephila clavata TaxID=2740835 RepID=A0A8X6K9C8_TRICU|nr:hypothetical protein TNCT_242341 [Trichonephila clavata]